MRKTALAWSVVFLVITLGLPEGWGMGRRPSERGEEKKAEDRVRAEAAAPAPLPPLTLEDCYDLALKRSETVAIRKEDIEEAEAQFLKATSEALGDVDFIMEDFRQDAPKPRDVEGGPGFGSTFNARHRRERRFTIQQPLFQGFKSLGALTGAGSFKKQRQKEWLRAKELLFIDVASAFYGVLRAQKDVENLEGIRVLLEERVQDLKKREEIGRSRLSEVVAAETGLRRTEGGLARARGVLEVSRHLLEFLTGIPIELERLQEEDLPGEELGLLETYLPAAEVRSDVEASEYAMKTAKRAILIAQSGLWPEISLENNQYVKREGFQRDFDWDLLVRVDVPLLRGGETFGQIKESVARWKKSKLAYSQTKREAELEIKEAYEDWIASVEQKKALEEALRSAQENYRLQKQEYTQNLVSNLEVLESLESLFETRREANRAHYEMKESYRRLQVATGDVV